MIHDLTNLAQALRRLASAGYLRGGGAALAARCTRDSAFPGRAPPSPPRSPRDRSANRPTALPPAAHSSRYDTSSTVPCYMPSCHRSTPLLVQIAANPHLLAR
ncbi:unnamed protein product [Euphydryas editha]|uniref:Uncharacterized protein n=1 Tax=Euphydryas editha TaxID=104508 RepID=A0AAU9UYI3_EUPED|nr:unnamed protein product [Euphydryas editha]